MKSFWRGVAPGFFFTIGVLSFLIAGIAALQGYLVPFLIHLLGGIIFFFLTNMLLQDMREGEPEVEPTTSLWHRFMVEYWRLRLELRRRRHLRRAKRGKF
jgi:hypothetical protein